MLVLRGLIGGLFQVALIATLLLVPAGTWQWTRALQFLAFYWVLVSTSIVTLALLAPASLETRLAAPAAKDQPKADRIVTAFFVLALLGSFAFIPLDVFHWKLLPPPTPLVSSLGAGVFLLGFGLIWATLFQNAFAAPVVTDQSEKGHVLIDTGIYAHMRHPFYTGLLFFLAGLGLWLESTTSLLFLALPLVCVIARIHVEEKTLVETLDGYREYTARVRYRLIPYVW